MTTTQSSPEAMRVPLPRVPAPRGSNLPVSYGMSDTQGRAADRAPSSPPTSTSAIPRLRPSAGKPTATSGHGRNGTQTPHAAGGAFSPPTSDDPMPNVEASAGHLTPEGQISTDTHSSCALGSISTSDQEPPDAQMGSVAGGPLVPEGQAVDDAHFGPALGGTPSSDSGQRRLDTQKGRAAVGLTAPPSQRASDTQGSPAGRGPFSDNGHALPETHGRSAVVGPIPPLGHSKCDTQRPTVERGPILRDGLLAIMADAVDDLERTRIASENRYRQLTRAAVDKDGEERGLGLDDTVPEVLRVRQVVDGLIALEHQAILTMNRQVRKHPLWKTWGVNQKGVGEKQFARLLAAVGDPFWNDLHDRPRRVSELWSYCGYSVVHPTVHMPIGDHPSCDGGVAPKRTKGQVVNWSTAARMRVWNITGSCLKAQGDYAKVYYATREKYADATHVVACVRCGPAGKPAQPGSPLSAAHQHARALRAIGKELLRDMWIASRALHEAAS